MLVDDAGVSGRTGGGAADVDPQGPATLDPDAVRTVLGTNALGMVWVTHAMLPLLRRAASPRIVDAARPRCVATDLTCHASSRTPAARSAASTSISTGPDGRCWCSVTHKWWRGHDHDPAGRRPGHRGHRGHREHRGALAAELLARGVPVRAMVRRPADAERLSERGTETVLADLDDGASVAAALRGVRRAYLVTPSSERAQEQQERFVQAAARAGVEHLVVLSRLGAAAESPVRYLRYHAAVEQRVRELGIGHTFLRPDLFFQGLLAFAPGVADRGVLPAPIGGARVSAVDVRDIAAVGAAVLAGASHLGQALTITGPAAITHAEMAEQIGVAAGREVTFVEVSGPDFAAEHADAFR